ncbi:MAG TPA: hypothetical protein VH637_15660 [Streptosporangiaceae bacterium]|jgi:uncharacterized membrane protein YgcG
MSKRAAALAAVWLAAVLLATAGVTAVLIVAGNRVFGPGVTALSQAQVSRDLAKHRAAQTASPSGPASPPARSSSAPAGPAPKARSFTGGTVFASCAAGLVTLTQRIPAQGYQIEHVSPGPAATASVTFETGTTEQHVTVTCAAGQPRFSSSTEVPGGGDDHGGGRGGRGGGPGGGSSGGNGGP